MTEIGFVRVNWRLLFK